MIELGKINDQPKRNWVLERLKEMGINYDIYGTRVLVPEDRLIEALKGTLLLKVGELQVDVDQKDIVAGDLPDGHELFRTKLSKMLFSNPPTVHSMSDFWGIEPTKQRLGSESGRMVSPISPIEIVPPTPKVPEKSMVELTTHDLGTIDVVMLDVESSNISAIGCRALAPVQIADEDFKCIIFVRFKGNPSIYRYSGDEITMKTWNFLEEQVVLKLNGDPHASVGHWFHELVKVPANEMRIQTMKLEENGDWKVVVPRVKKEK